MSNKKKRQIGYFWVVWDMLVCETTTLDTDSESIVDDGKYIRINVDRSAAWEKIKEENSFPKKKDADAYPHGEVMFDTEKCKFRVVGTPKIVQIASYQRRIIKKFGLSTYTIFQED